MKEKIFCSECRHCSGYGEEALCSITYKEYLGAYEVTKQYEKVSDANKDNSCPKFVSTHHFTREEYILTISLLIISLITVLLCSILI